MQRKTARLSSDHDWLQLDFHVVVHSNHMISIVIYTSHVTGAAAGAAQSNHALSGGNANVGHVAGKITGGNIRRSVLLNFVPA